ncbi:MAG: diaminopimelate epimerase [Pseudomonadota bacterium]
MNTRAHTGMPFIKMHGLGNDFVVVDARARDLEIDAALVRAVGDRRRGIGFDQFAKIDRGQNGADVHLTFWNPDGSESAACGNATRCIARMVMEETGRKSVNVTTARGDLFAEDAGGGLTSVNMGMPQLNWRDIPLSKDVDTLELPIQGAPTATGMGNPHCTFFVDDADAVALEEFGARYEHHPLYPERTNVQVVHVVGPDHLRMRVWERGTGVTLASGSSSCAVAVAATRRGLTGRRVKIDLDGGQLSVEWREDGVWMTGPTAHVCDGVIASDFLEHAT